MRWTLMASAGLFTACTGATHLKDTAESTPDSSGTAATTGTTEPAPTGRITGLVVDESAVVNKNPHDLNLTTHCRSREGCPAIQRLNVHKEELGRRVLLQPA